MVEHAWPAIVPYGEWRDTCDTLHAHTQLLGKVAVALAPPQPQLQHAALHLGPRGWESAPLPTPGGEGFCVVSLDLATHEAVVDVSSGPQRRVPLTPNRPVGAVTRDVLAAVEELVGPVTVNLRPQEVPWDVPLDQDDVHRTYDEAQVAAYMRAATRAAIVLGALRAPYRGRSSPVNAWWGTFDLAVSLYSGRPATPPSTDFIMRNAANAQQIEVGWWPGDRRYPRAAFFAFASPAPDGYAEASLSPPAARWDPDLGEYLLDWDDVVSSTDPHGAALAFGRSAVAHACAACGWDPVLAGSAQGDPPPVE